MKNRLVLIMLFFPLTLASAAGQAERSSEGAHQSVVEQKSTDEAVIKKDLPKGKAQRSEQPTKRYRGRQHYEEYSDSWKRYRKRTITNPKLWTDPGK